ncbi:MAG: phosphotransferase [Spirochaetia bacterium]|nr:phosphotransferase [Spirochaetia bacterium]
MNNLIIEKIVSQYFAKDKYISIEKLNSGLTNFNYHIYMQNDQHCFLKVFRNADQKRVLGITNLINNILKHHFPTPDLISCNNRYYWQDENHIAIMTRFIKGRYPEKNVTNLYKIGTILGMLHQIPVFADLLQGYSLNYYEQRIKILQFNTSKKHEFEKFIKTVDPIIQKIPENGFHESIIHGDVFLDNLLLTDFDDIFFIDFEGGCIDKSIFDLARAVIGCAVYKNEINLDLAAALITGYDKTRKLDLIEREFLFEYIIYAGTVSTLWRFIEFNINRPNENKSSLFEELMQPTLNFVKLKKNFFDASMKAGLIF